MHKYDPDRHHRRSVRLCDYDYSQEGLYFVTVCTEDHEYLFGHIVNGEMRLNTMGEVVCREWLKTAELRPNVQLHEFVVMPNHFHGIVEITEKINPEQCKNNNDGCRGVACNARLENGIVHLGVACNAPTSEQNEYMSSISPKRGALSTIIRAFKSAVTKNIHEMGYPFSWQRNLYEHIIRDIADYARIAEYIGTNPRKWEEDIFYNE
jgi:REP element-mobilizing transposase RayT